MSTSFLVTEKLGKSYGAIKAVEGIDLEVKRGRSLCILGRSGCGKTTLLKMLGLILKPDHGRVFIDGVDFSRSSEQEMARSRLKIGFSFQEPLLLPYLNALQNLSLVVSKVTARNLRELELEATQLLSQLGLSKRLGHLPSKLSVGEKNRIDLARAILKHPAIIIADEPFANLDPETSLIVAGALRNHLRTGGILVFSSTEPSHTKQADDCLRF